MIKKVTDFEGRFPQMEKIDQWILVDLHYGWNAVHAVEGTVVNNNTMVVKVDEDYGHFRQEQKRQPHDPDKLVTIHAPGGKVIIDTQFSKVMEQFKELQDKRAEGNDEIQRTFLDKIRDLNAFWNKNEDILLRVSDYSKIWKKEADCFGIIARRFGFEDCDDYFTDDDAWILIDILRTNKFTFNDEQNKDIRTTIDLRNAKAVYTDVEVDGRSCIQIVMGDTDDLIFNIFEDKNKSLYKVLDKLY